MIEAHAIELSKYVLYDDARFEFEPGVTRIGGGNRSGKSLMFSGLYNLLFGAPPVMASKRAAKQMFSRPGGYYQFEGASGGVPFVIRQSARGQSVEYSVSIDGKDQGKLTQTAAADVMSEIIPGNERLFSSTVYITSVQGNPLQFGTGAERMKYLEMLFDIEAFDTLREKIAGLLEKSRGAVTELTLLREEYDAIGKPDPLAGRVANLMDKVVLRSQAELRAKERFELNNIELKTLEGQLRFKEDDDALKTMLKDLRDKVSTSNSKIHKLKAARKKQQEAEESVAKYTELTKTIASQTSNLEDFRIRFNLRGAENQLPEVENISRGSLVLRKFRYDAMKTEMTDRLENLRADRDLINFIASHIEAYDPKAKTFKRAKAAVAQALDIIKTMSGMDEVKLSKHLKTCPLCRQGLPNADTVNKNLKKLKLAKTFIDTITESKALRFLSISKEVVRDDLQAVSSPLAAIEDRCRYIETMINIFDNRESVRTELRYFPVRELDEPDERNYDMLVSAQNAAYHDAKKQIEKIEIELSIREKIAAKRGRFNHVETNVTQRTVEIGSRLSGMLREKIDRQRGAQRRRADIAKRVSELSKIADREDVLKALHDAYGPRGLKVDHMSSIASLLENSFNDYAATIFPEPIFFNLTVAPTKMDVRVERNSISSDVALLSGSETRMFQILSMAALMEFLPEKYRWDTVVFDEIEANMKDDTRKFLMQTCIPQLAKSIKKINIISPLSQEELFIEHGDDYSVREFEVIKAKGKSTLVRTE